MRIDGVAPSLVTLTDVGERVVAALAKHLHGVDLVRLKLLEELRRDGVRAVVVGHEEI